MDLNQINQKLQSYDKQLRAVFVEGYIDTPSGIPYKDRGVRIQWINKGNIHDIADYFKMDANPDKILKDLQRIDVWKGAKSFEDIQNDNKAWEKKIDIKAKEEMNERNKDTADYATKTTFYMGKK